MPAMNGHPIITGAALPIAGVARSYDRKCFRQRRHAQSAQDPDYPKAMRHQPHPSHIFQSLN